jgi:hypothetical protein
MMLMSVNFGSKPKMSCNTVIESVMIIGFLYFKMNCFIALTAAAAGCAAR